MGRPFAIIGFSMFASLFFICALGITCAYAVLAVSGVVLLIFLILPRLRQHKAVILSAAAVLLAGVLFCVHFHCFYRPCEKYFEKPVRICASLKDYPTYKYDKYYLELKVIEVDGKKVTPFGIRMSTNEIADAEPGDTIRFSTTLYSAGSDTKFYRLNYISKGIYASCFSSEEPIVEKSAHNKSVSEVLAGYRHAIVLSLQRLMPGENAALASAVLIGDKSYISTDSLEAITAAGISHIICVSGLHLSILGFAVIRLFGALKVSRRVKYLAAGAFIVFFMALCGFSNSVVRAGLMFLVYIAAELLLAEPDSLNSLGFAACIILLNPFSAGNIGFIFSFLATFSIITLGTKLTAHFKQKWEISKQPRFKVIIFGLFEILLISLVVNAFCLPFSVLIFNKIGLMSIVANVLILPFATVLLITSGLSAVFGLFHYVVADIAAYPAAFIASSLCRYILIICRFLAKLPLANISAASPIWLVMCVIWLIGIGLACLLYRKKSALRIIAAVMAVMFAAGIGFQVYTTANKVSVTVHSLGSQVCITLNSGKEFIVIDAGNHAFTYNKVKDSLFAANKEKIDYFFITAAANNQSGKAGKILASFPVSECYVPQSDNLLLSEETADSTRFYQTDYACVQTKNGVNISYYALKFSAVHIAYENQSVLFLNRAGADISILPRQMQHFDYLIVCANTNNSFKKMKTNAIIEIRNERDTAHEADLQQVCKSYYATDALEDIRITLGKNKSIIGSTNEWQQ